MASRDLSGKTFGHWLVRERAGKTPSGLDLWSCKCSCGSEANVSAKALVSGHSRSCGCYRRAMNVQLRLKDLVGRRFGDWEVISAVPPEEGKRRRWQCRCACGAERAVIGSNLTTGLSQSCGECRRVARKSKALPLSS